MTLDPSTMLRSGPGTLTTWVRWVIQIACAVTIVAVALGGHLIVGELAWDTGGQNLVWVREGAAWFATLAIFFTALPSSRISRLVRLGVLLPLVHACVVGVVWYIWRAALPLLAESSDARAFAADFPLVRTWLGATVAFVMFAGLFARKGDWAHGFAIFGLAELLLVGLWLPIACAITSSGSPADWWFADAPLLPHPLQSMLLVVIPPTLVASVFTAVSLVRPARIAASRSTIKGGLVALFVVALCARMGAGARPMVVYSNFVPILLAAMLVAVTGLCSLAAATLVRGYQLRRAFLKHDRVVGVVRAEGPEPVFAVEITSWLRGPRLWQRSFEIQTATGTIPVTGAELVAPLPDSSTLLRGNQTLGIVYPGQPVVFSGGGQDSGGPFRASSALISGSLFVAPEDVGRAGFTSAALALWRPCVAYLLIVTAVALPALAALLA